MSEFAAKRTDAFNPKTVLGLILFGAAAFFAALYFIGSGQTGGDLNDGSAHVAGKGLNGYAALAQMLEEDGYDVSRSRSQASLDDTGLLVLTPPQHADAEALSTIIRDRAYIGPTLIIVPKWVTSQLPAFPGGEAEDGWVELLRSQSPEWAAELDGNLSVKIVDEVAGTQSASQWSGLGRAGALPEPRYSSATGARLIPLVQNRIGNVLAGYIDDGGYYPALAAVAGAGADPGAAGAYGQSKWPVAFVIEPDLMNNYGFARPETAELSRAMIDLLAEGGDLPIMFDLTLNGLGAQQNLLTLAFTPPFLAATLCLMLAMLIIGWRAFRRFGPPVAEGRAIAFGKERLVKNSASFIQRSKRLHLLSGPYLAMVNVRIAKALGLRHADVEAISTALANRFPDAPSYAHSAARLRDAQKPKDILSAATALKSIERMLSQ